MSLQINSFEFGDFCLKVKDRILLRGGKPVQLTPKTLQLLVVLVENHGQIVEKEDLMRAVWTDSFVEESNLTFTISLLRKALQDDKKTLRYIETVPKRGYRFIGDVVKIAEAAESVDSNEKNLSSYIYAPRSKKFAAGFAMLLLLAAGFAVSWYALNKKVVATLPIFSAPFTLEKTSVGGKIYSAAISPDGKMTVYTNEVGGKQSLWLKQLDANGSNVQIIPPSDDVYYKLAFAPGGNFIYFVRAPKDKGNQSSLYRLSIFGGVPEKIVSEQIGSFSFSPEGDKISFVRRENRDDEFYSLWIADARDGKNARKIVVRPRPLRIADHAFAPDGQRIVFAVGQSENAGNEFGLQEINLETGVEREFSPQKFFNIKSLFWLSDQSSLLVTAAKIPNKAFRIWRVFAAPREAVPLTKDSENYACISIDAQAETLCATQVKEDFHLRLFDLQNYSAEGKDLTAAFTAAFAPNGKIVFSSPISGSDEIWSMNADGSEQRQLTGTAADEFMPVTSADGNTIFFTSNRTNEMHVWRMNFDGSNQLQLTETNGGIPMAASPDGRWLYYLHGLERTLWRVSTGGGGEQMVLKKPKNRFALSPDGSTIVYGERQGEEKFFIFANVSNGQTIRKITYPDSKAVMHEVVFAPDGKSLIFILSGADFEGYSLWRQSLEEKKPPQRINDLGTAEITSFAVAPDGNRVLIVQGNWKHDAVLIKGLK